MSKGVIALDADGVLLDYSLAYASAWERAFGEYPQERDPRAYWPIDRWAVERLTGQRLEQLRGAFDESFWSSIPAIPGAVQACHQLVGAGYELVCVTALSERYTLARKDNLRRLGFPVEAVYTTGNQAAGRSPKADRLNALKPLAFVDDFLPYLVGVEPQIHRALIMRGATGSPNEGDLMHWASSQHADLQAFARWWFNE